MGRDRILPPRPQRAELLAAPWNCEQQANDVLAQDPHARRIECPEGSPLGLPFPYRVSTLRKGLLRGEVATMNAEKASSTQRALAVLDCFSTKSPSLTLSEIARLLGQPISSTHRQVGELARWGALERDDHGRYRIGLHLWEIGSLAPRSKSLREAALPYLEDLYEATHENVQAVCIVKSQVAGLV
jgi:hypothetical protein